MRASAVKVAMLGGLGLLVARRADAVELKNDAFPSGGSVTFHAGFVAGEIGASRFTAPADGMQLTHVRFLFGGAAGTSDITLHIWDDSAGTDMPGTDLFTDDFQVTADDDTLHEIDLTASNITVPETFRIGVELVADGVPSIASDGDGLTADRNFASIDGIGWVQSGTIAVPGDWIIRAEVSSDLPTEDAGPSDDAGPTDDAGSNDAGSDGGNGATTSDADGGCGCRAGGRDHATSIGGVLAGLLAMMFVRRR